MKIKSMDPENIVFLSELIEDSEKNISELRCKINDYFEFSETYMKIKLELEAQINVLKFLYKLKIDRYKDF